MCCLSRKLWCSALLAWPCSVRDGRYGVALGCLVPPIPGRPSAAGNARARRVWCISSHVVPSRLGAQPPTFSRFSVARRYQYSVCLEFLLHHSRRCLPVTAARLWLANGIRNGGKLSSRPGSLQWLGIVALGAEDGRNCLLNSEVSGPIGVCQVVLIWVGQ